MKDIIKSLKQVYKNPLFIFLSFLTSFFVLVISIWLPNLHLVQNTITSSTYTFTQKINFFIASLGALDTNFTFLSKELTITIAIIFGINLSFAVYYFRNRISLQKQVGTSLGGVLFGFLGVGCASCGSVILASFVGMGTTAGLLSPLPFKGQEFAILGLILLLSSTIFMAKKLQDPLVCKPQKFI